MAPIIFVFLFIPAIALSLAAREFAILPLDVRIAEALEHITNPAFSALMKGISVLGETDIAEALIIIAAAGFALRRRWFKAAFVLATSSSLLMTSSIKAAVARPRPTPAAGDGSGLLRTFDSFPSGHVVFFIVFFGMLGYLAWGHLRGYLRWACIALCTAMILLVGVSRVYLQAHWPSDVLGGYLIGGAWLIVLAGMYEWATSRLDTNRT